MSEVVENINFPLFPRQADCLEVLHNTMYVLYGGARGGGKLSNVDEPVLTPKGWVKIGSLVVGDMVTDPTTGGSCRVVAVHPQGVQRIFRVTCDDGAWCQVGLEHLWAYKTANHMRPRTKVSSQRVYSKEYLGATTPDERWNTLRVGNTAELMDCMKRGASPRIPLTEPVQYTVNGRVGGVDPYLIGVLLGDGFLGDPSITACDDEVRDYIAKCGFYGTGALHTDGKHKAWHIKGDGRKQILRWIANHNLTGKHSWDKFLPSYILTANIEYRHQVLRGLMDTDGYVDERGRCYYCTTSQMLADDVCSLVRGLGGKAKIRIKHPTYTSHGEKLDGRLAYDIRIWMRKTSSLFTIERKRKRCTDSWNGGHELMREIVKITEVKPQEAVCITVSSPYGLYVTRNYIVTHNSHLGREYLKLRAIRYPGTQHLIIRKTFPELQRNHVHVLEQSCPWLRHVKSDHKFYFSNGSTLEYGYCETDRDLMRWQGSEFATIVLDEAQFHQREIFNFFKTCLRTSSESGIKPRMLLTGNPGGYAWLKQTFIDGAVEHDERRQDFAFVKSLVTDNPAIMNNDPEYVQRLKSLPPALRAAFLEGDWNAIIGAFFTIPPEVEEQPFEIDEGACRGHLYAAVDHGIRHSTASGLAYIDENDRVHLLFTYLASGSDAETHAKEIADRIKAFPHTHGVMPVKLFYDPSMGNETRLNSGMISSPLAEYKRVFEQSGMAQVIFEPANNSRAFGAQMLQQYLSADKGLPKLQVWQPYNREFRALLSQIMVDKNNIETYAKEDTPADDLADFARYLVVGCHAEIGVKRKASDMVMRTMRRASEKRDWYNV